MNLKEKFKEWNKSWADMSIEELEKKYKNKKTSVWFVLIIAFSLMIIALFLILTQEIFGIVGGLVIMFFAEFQMLKVADLSNDLNRIKMWIYLKKKLGD